MPLFICFLCDNEKGMGGRKFEADAAVCPNCGATAAHPRMKDKVVPLATVHFEPPSKWKGIGVGHLACLPDKKFPDPAATVTATGEPAHVNCPKCKATEVFKAWAEKLGVPEVLPEADFKLEPAAADKE